MSNTKSFQDTLPSPYLCIETTSYGGRGFFANQDIPKGTVVLECPTPLSSNLFRQYKKDACAYCMKSNFYKPCKVKLNQQHVNTCIDNFKQRLNTIDQSSQSSIDSSKLVPPNSFSLNPNAPAFAGLFFCSNDCANSWLQHEDPTGLISLVLNTVDQAVLSSNKNPAAKSSEDIYGKIDEAFEKEGKKVCPELVQQRWTECIMKLGPSAHENCKLKSSSSSTISTPVASTSPSIEIVTPTMVAEDPTPIEMPTRVMKNLTLSFENLTEKTDTRKQKKKKTKKVVLKLSQEEQDVARFVSIIIVKHFLKTVAPAVENGIDDGMSHFDNLQSNELLYLSKFPWMLSSHLQIFSFLHQSLPSPIVLYLTESLFRASLGRDAANAFGIWQLPVTPESELLGSSLYPLASFFNHSCRHTVDKIRTGRTLGFVTNQDIKSNDQLYINYGMYNELDRKSRQETLKDQWFFGCLCDKCEEQK